MLICHSGNWKHIGKQTLVLGTYLKHLPENVEVALKLMVGRGWEHFEKHNRKSLDYLEHRVKYMDVKNPAGEDSEGSEQHGRVSFYHFRNY